MLWQGGNSLSHAFGPLGIEIVEAGRAVADEFVLIELPDDFPILIEFEQLRAVRPGVAIGYPHVPFVNSCRHAVHLRMMFVSGINLLTSHTTFLSSVTSTTELPEPELIRGLPFASRMAPSVEGKGQLSSDAQRFETAF